MMNNKQLHKEIQRLEIDVVEKRRTGENERRISEQKDANDSQAAYLMSDAMKHDRDADEMEQRIEQMKQQLQQQQERAEQLRRDRSRLIDEHESKIATIDREISNLEG